MKPMLRPMSLGEILDRSFQIYRARFLVFAAVSSIPLTGMFLVHLIDIFWLHLHSLINTNWLPGQLAWNFFVSVGYYHVLEILSGVIFPAFIVLSAGEILGKSESLHSALFAVRSRWRNVLWISFLKLIVILVIPELIAFGIVIAESAIIDATGYDPRAGMPSNVIVIVPVAVAFALFLWLGASLCLTIPSAVLEQRRGLGALRRAWSLGKGWRVRVTLLWLFLTIFAWLVTVSVTLLLNWFVRLLWISHIVQIHSRHLYEIVAQVVSFVIAASMFSILPISLTLIYYDQRIRLEGFDIEWMMDASGMTTMPEKAPPMLAAEPEMVEETQG